MPGQSSARHKSLLVLYSSCFFPLSFSFSLIHLLFLFVCVWLPSKLSETCVQNTVHDEDKNQAQNYIYRTNDGMTNVRQYWPKQNELVKHVKMKALREAREHETRDEKKNEPNNERICRKNTVRENTHTKNFEKKCTYGSVGWVHATKMQNPTDNPNGKKVK